jgi:Flp pilus assembly secretin CpaC
VRHRIALAVPVLVALLFATAADAAEITGSWVGKTEVPGQGTDQVTMVLKKTSTGAYAGTISDSLGQITPDTEIKNISWTNDALTCSFPLADGSNIKMTVQLAEGKLSGDWVHEQGETGPIVFEKK